MYGEKVSQVRGAVYVIGRGTKGRVEVSNNKRNVVGMMNVERQQVPLKEYILFFIDDAARNKFCYIGWCIYSWLKNAASVVLFYILFSFKQTHTHTHTYINRVEKEKERKKEKGVKKRKTLERECDSFFLPWIGYFFFFVVHLCHLIVLVNSRAFICSSSF